MLVCFGYDFTPIWFHHNRSAIGAKTSASLPATICTFLLVHFHDMFIKLRQKSLEYLLGTDTVVIDYDFLKKCLLEATINAARSPV